MRARTLLLITTLFAAHCGGPPKVGDPCSDTVRVCGENGIGLECQMSRLAKICDSGCMQMGDDINNCRTVNICIANNMQQCGM